MIEVLIIIGCFLLVSWIFSNRADGFVDKLLNWSIKPNWLDKKYQIGFKLPQILEVPKNRKKAHANCPQIIKGVKK